MRPYAHLRRDKYEAIGNQDWLRTLIIPADITDLIIILGIETLSFMMLVQPKGKNWLPLRSLGVFQRTFRKGVFKVTFFNTFVFRHVGVVS